MDIDKAIKKIHVKFVEIKLKSEEETTTPWDKTKMQCFADGLKEALKILGESHIE